MRALIGILGLAVGVYLVLALMLYFLQGRMVYLSNFPGRELSATPGDIGLRHQDVSLTTSDGKRLHGWYVPAADAKGAILFFHGNAGNISHRLDSIRIFNQLSLDTLIIDYRGYGRSEGKRRLKAIVHDVKEILTGLIAQGYEERIVYAMSLGGVFLLNSLEPDTQLDKIIIDSTPSRLSDYGCPIEYDPIEHLPDDCRNILIVTGQRDNVVTPAMSKDLALEAEHRNATVISDPEFSHPFMDANAAIHQRRMREIQHFALQ